MSNRFATHKKITKFRKKLPPDVIKNLESLSNDQQQSLESVNELFQDLNFLVGLADLFRNLGKHFIQKAKMLAHYYMEGTQIENQVPFVL